MTGVRSDADEWSPIPVGETTPAMEALAVLPYEMFTGLNWDKVVAEAENFLREGWVLDVPTRLSLFEAIPWSYTRPEHRSWNFHIHCFDMLDALLAAYCVSNNTSFLEPALSVFKDWVAYLDSELESKSEMVWYDMAVGMRCYRIAYLYQAAYQNGLLSEHDKTALWRILLLHCDYLADDENIAFHNNHGYFQIAGQLALGRRFAGVSEPMADLFRQGQTRLAQMLDQQFAGDGVHTEHSPDYHRMVVSTLSGMIKSEIITEPASLALALRAEESLAWFVKPNGKLANFGDSDDRVVETKEKAALKSWSHPLLQSVTGARQLPRQSGMKVFDQGGYVVVRIPSPHAPADPTADSYLAQTACFHSRTHKHADDLSFIYTDKGQNILIDSGRYGYIGKTEINSDAWLDGFWYSDPMRIYMESTRAHNTVAFDGKNFRRRKTEFYGSAIVSTQETDGVYAIETRCKHFRTTVHSRVLIFKPQAFLVVFDHYVNNLKEPHAAEQWFHLDPALAPQKTCNLYTADLNTDENETLFITPLVEGATGSGIIKGQVTPQRQGWFSPTTQEVHPAPSFHYSLPAAPTGVFATLFSFNGHPEPLLSYNRINVSGRNARLAWVDDQGRHDIVLAKVPELTLRYALTAQDQKAQT